ncbi:hypothetical protein F4802DRAFT_599472 [Xylaria palmicola]|nr:hypothetical protein F4802DRAFT_599472 [Xylaria palmicola]
MSKDALIINGQLDGYGTPISLACMSQLPMKYLAFLLEAGADPNQDQDVTPTPLASVAAFYKDTEAAELLIKHGAKDRALRGPSRSREETDHPATGLPKSAVHVATRRGNADVLMLLLEHGFRSDMKDREGRTPSEELLAKQQ